MKVFLKLLLIAFLLGYLIFAGIKLHNYHSELNCQKIDICIIDSAQADFITPQKVESMLRKNNCFPLHRPLDELNTVKIQDVLLKNAFINAATCYIAASNNVNISILQRIPLLRIIPSSGNSFYLDHHGHPMHTEGYAANLVVATGHIDTAYAHHKLLPLALYIDSNPFWSKQIEQINVQPDQTICMYPRIGQHIIYFGKTDNFIIKLRNLKAFYEKVLSQIGWNNYEELDVSHINQVIGRKKRTNLTTTE